MKRVYGIKQSSVLNEAVMVCESYQDALLLAEKIAVIGDDKAVEDYVIELPYITAEPAFVGDLLSAFEVTRRGDK